jgi:hypothetical protein
MGRVCRIYLVPTGLHIIVLAYAEIDIQSSLNYLFQLCSNDRLLVLLVYKLQPSNQPYLTMQINVRVLFWFGYRQRKRLSFQLLVFFSHRTKYSNRTWTSVSLPS